MKNLILILTISALIMACKSQQQTSNVESENTQRSHSPRNKERPSIDDLFKMDKNLDGKLSLDEVEGPLQRDFSRIDSNEDGFITREEFENAPKPEKGQRPPRNR